MGIAECKLIELPKISDPRGNLTFVEARRSVPFPIERVYYLYDVPGGETRAGHGHRALSQLMLAVSGSFDVLLDDGREQRKYHLNRPHVGLYIAPMIWRELENFSSGSVCVVLASAYYDPSDYFYVYEDFMKAVEAQQR
ncbi:MAG TPA: FdtA/QdtA family cupin domain-containing protein [Pyrinomonadaceae bacterium]|jgi:dTDP-4-dehydrorhamnose 3,5-epimerase-like enzyme|nr:FdtA/QdtA family cupin domain-containing protein [Pyrinomonadaceae bacterium]